VSDPDVHDLAIKWRLKYEEMAVRIHELERCLDGGVDCANERITQKARIRELEAALREVADFSEQFIADDEDGDERMYKVHTIADTALGFQSDAGAEPKKP
jgi:hypothetical protein